MRHLRVVVESHAADSLRQLVRDNLAAYNLAVTGCEEFGRVGRDPPYRARCGSGPRRSDLTTCHLQRGLPRLYASQV